MTPSNLNLGTSWKLCHLNAPAALLKEKGTPLPIGQEAGWSPDPVWARWQKEKSLSLPGNEPQSSSTLQVTTLGFSLKLIGMYILHTAIHSCTNTLTQVS